MNDTISPDAETGLRADQVAQKRAQGRQNVLDDRATKSTAQILKDNVCTLFNLFNLLIAAALALVGAWSNLLFLLVVALNTLIGIAQEVHAKRLVENLSLLSLPTARVIRDGGGILRRGRAAAAQPGAAELPRGARIYGPAAPRRRAAKKGDVSSMTIQKRLFLSNLLMLVIPALLAVLVLMAALFLFASAALPAESARLRAALAALEGVGTVSDGQADLFGAQISVGGAAYRVEIWNPVVSVESRTIRAQAVVFGFFVVVIVLFLVFLTNRFLIRFVFRHISEPLTTLAEGVRQIRDGNLDHRIAHAQRDEFQPVCEAFNEMADRLRASVEQSQREEEGRKELLASISHDVRSPLTSIRAYVEGLLDGVADTPEKQRAYLSIAQKKAVEIDDLVKKLFQFSKMDMGEFPYSPERLCVAEEVADFLQASAEAYAGRGLRVACRGIPPDAYIEADPTYFRSILTNLLDNSAKYRKGDQDRATIAGERAGRQIRLFVDDDGPGVPEAALPKLFDAFYRNDPSRKNPDQGSGPAAGCA